MSRADADSELAGELATAAGRVLLELRRLRRAAGPELGALGDRRSQEFLAAELARRRPGDAVLSEEALDDPARLTADRVWIVDPLDGTREFSEPDREDWAVHVALWESGRLAAGAVALPARGVTLRTPAVALAERRDGPPRLVVSRTRPPVLATRVRERLGGRLVAMGSAGAKVASIVLGEADIYLHAGGQYEWDSAAPVAVGTAAGLHASRLDGSALRYNRPDPRLPDLLVCRREDAEGVLAAAAEAAEAGGG